MGLKYSTTVRNNRLQAIIDNAGTGSILRFYSGTRPTTVAGPITGTLLAQLSIAGALGTISAGVLTVGTITGDSSANNSGLATHFRLWKSDGTTAVLDGTIGLAGTVADIQLSSVNIVAGQPVQMSAWTITEGN